MQHPARAGFALVELVISAAVLVGLFAGVLALSLAGAGAFRSGTSRMDLQTRARVALDRMARELGPAGRDTLFPDPQPLPGVQGLGAATLDFEACLGAAGGIPLFGPPQRFAFEYEPLELDNGLDDDRDGLVDEGQVVWISDLGGPNERRVVLASGVSELLEGELPNSADDNGNGLVDERGLVFDADGDRLILRLSLQRASDRRVLVRTHETSILLRN
jgi:hypothetical protein